MATTTTLPIFRVDASSSEHSSLLRMTPPPEDLCDSSVSSCTEESNDSMLPLQQESSATEWTKRAPMTGCMPCTIPTAIAPEALSIKSAILLHMKPRLPVRCTSMNDVSSCASTMNAVMHSSHQEQHHQRDETEPVLPAEIVFDTTTSPCDHVSSTSENDSPRKKSVRFAECEETGRIQHSVRHFVAIESADNAQFWWSSHQLRQIRRVCSDVVSEYSSHGDDLILAYLRLQKKTLTSEEFRRSRNRLAESFETRGLEHIVAKAATDLQHRRYMDTVMNAQRSLQTRGQRAAEQENGNDAEALVLAKIAQKESLASRQMAQRMAICDYHAAMHVHLEKHHQQQQCA